MEIQKTKTDIKSSEEVILNTSEKVSTLFEDIKKSIEESIITEERRPDDMERRLLAEKIKLERQLEMARELGKQFEKMKDAAIKRFKIDV